MLFSLLDINKLRHIPYLCLLSIQLTTLSIVDNIEKHCRGVEQLVACRAHNPEVEWFESLPRYHFCFYGGVAQLVRAAGSYPAGHGFDSNRRYQYNGLIVQSAKTPPFHGGNRSSNLLEVTNTSKLGGIAQLGEHMLYTHGVTGSSPVVPTKISVYLLGRFFYLIYIFPLYYYLSKQSSSNKKSYSPW